MSDIRTPRQVHRRAHRNEAGQGMDGAKTLIAGGSGAMPIPFQVVKELTHDRGGKIFDCHAVNRDAGVFAREWQQQCQRVAVADLRVSRHIPFADQVL